MKKVVLRFLLLALLSIGLWGCGSKEKKLNDATEDIMEATKEWNVDKIKDLVIDMGVIQENNEGYDIYGEIFADYLKECNAKMTYEIEDIDEKEMIVQIKCNYIDSTEFIEELFKEVFRKLYSDEQYLEGADSKQIEEEFRKLVETAKAAVKEDKYIENEFELIFTEDKQTFKVKEIKEDLANVMTAGCYRELLNMGDKDENYDDEADFADGGPFEEDRKKEIEAEKKVSYDTTVLENGILLEVTNNYTEKISKASFDVDFLDKTGNILESSTQEINCFEPKEKRMVFLEYTEEEAMEDYNVNLNCTIVSDEEIENHVSDIVIKHNIKKNKLRVKITNQAEKDINHHIKVLAIYYKENKPIYGEWNLSLELEEKKSDELIFILPYDKETYEKIEFDSYKLFVTDAYTKHWF